MTLLMQWFTPATLRLLALSLLHFLWQGAALGALAYVVLAMCRSAAARYTIGVTTMALMMAAPVGTFLVFRSQERASSQQKWVEIMPGASTPALFDEWNGAKKSKHSGGDESAPAYFVWLVEFWFAGVVFLSLRSAGGILLIEHLRRKETRPITNELHELCLELQRRMGLTRAIRYCESLQLDAPAVAGWLRPVVLVPFSALSGLSTAQLEAVIAHELAHIQRYDAFVNLFQVGVETLLFYHPAVWWIGKRIRIEREHCCDDVAVALCGNAVTYAHALTRIAESKPAPQLVMAANRSPLVERIARLLGAGRAAESMRGANLSAGVLCLSAALLAGSALLGSVHHAQAQTPVPARKRVVTLAVTVKAAKPSIHEHTVVREQLAVSAQTVAAQTTEPAVAVTVTPKLTVMVTPKPSIAAMPSVIRSYAYSYARALGYDFYKTPAPAPAPRSAPQASVTPAPAPQAEPGAPKQSYIDSLAAAGLTNLSVDNLISLKVQGITADYVKSMKEQNIKPDVDTLVGLKVQGITPEYVKEMRAATGRNLDSDELIEMKVQGITPEYIQGMRTATGQNLDADELIGMKVQGVTPEYVKQMHDLGLKTDADDIIGMKVQGVSAEYVRELRALGVKVDGDDIIGMKVQGVTPDYVKGFNDLGIHPSADELIGMKTQGVTPGYFKELQAAGFKVDVDDAIGAKVQGITPEFIAKVRSHGFKDLTLDKLIALKNSGVMDAEQ